MLLTRVNHCPTEGSTAEIKGAGRAGLIVFRFVAESNLRAQISSREGARNLTSSSPRPFLNNVGITKQLLLDMVVARIRMPSSPVNSSHYSKSRKTVNRTINDTRQMSQFAA